MSHWRTKNSLSINSEKARTTSVDTSAAGELLDRGDEVGLLVIDGPLGAQGLASRAFLRRAGGDEDPSADGLGELDRRGPDARGTAVDQDAFPGLEPGAIEEVAPDREEGLRQGRGGGPVEALGPGQALGPTGKSRPWNVASKKFLSLP